MKTTFKEVLTEKKELTERYPGKGCDPMKTFKEVLESRWSDVEEPKFKIGDTVGNSVDGFEWEIIENPDKVWITVKNTVTGEIRKTFRENMRKSR